MNITRSELDLADALLLKFYRQVELLYGKDVITPNMHLHCHLKQCLLDYGPVHNFWLFAYERYNGILESFPSNHRSLEIQLMKRFLREFKLSILSSLMPEQFKQDFGELMKNQFEPRLEGSLQVTVHGKYNERADPSKLKDWSINSIRSEVVFPSFYFRKTLRDTMLLELQVIYSSLYPTLELQLKSMNTIFRKFSHVTYRGICYNSKKRPIIYVRNPADMEVRAVLLENVVTHAFHLNDDVNEHVVVHVSWLKQHPAKLTCYGKPVELWWKDVLTMNWTLLFHCNYLFVCEVMYEWQTVYAVVLVHNIAVVYTQ